MISGPMMMEGNMPGKLKLTNRGETFLFGYWAFRSGVTLSQRRGAASLAGRMDAEYPIENHHFRACGLPEREGRAPFTWNYSGSADSFCDCRSGPSMLCEYCRPAHGTFPRRRQSSAFVCLGPVTGSFLAGGTEGMILSLVGPTRTGRWTLYTPAAEICLPRASGKFHYTSVDLSGFDFTLCASRHRRAVKHASCISFAKLDVRGMLKAGDTVWDKATPACGADAL